MSKGAARSQAFRRVFAAQVSRFALSSVPPLLASRLPGAEPTPRTSLSVFLPGEAARALPLRELSARERPSVGP